MLVGPEGQRAHVPDASRPTLVVFDGLSIACLGLDARAHHALSILLHLTTTAALVGWIGRAGASQELQLATALIFGLMGIHAQAIAVISFREDLLAASLGLGACLAAASGLQQRGASAWRMALLALIAQGLAVGAKWSALPLPLVFAMVHLLDPKSRETAHRVRVIVMTLVLTVASGLALAFTSWALGGGLPYADGADGVGLASRLPRNDVWLASAVILARRLIMMLAPWGLSPEAVDRGATWSDPGVIPVVLGLAALLVYAVACGLIALRSHTPTATAPPPTMTWRATVCVVVLSWLVLVLPVSNLVPMPNMDAERFMYLPSAPLAVALGACGLALGTYLSRHRSLDPVRKMTPVLALATLQGVALASALRPYASNTALWDAALRGAPGSARAHAMLGLQLAATLDARELVDEDLRRRARTECRIAAHHDPREELAYVCHARVALIDRDFGAAARAMDRALEIPSFRRDRLLAVAIEVALDDPRIPWEQRRGHALGLASDALSEHPFSPEVAAAAARVAHRAGAPHHALELLRRVRSLRPDRWETVVEAIEIALDQGRVQLAMSTWLAERALLAQAPEGRRRGLLRRLTSAARVHPPNLLHCALAPGVFRQ